MLKIDLYTLKGTKNGELSLPTEFGSKSNPNLLAQAIRVYEERSHVGLRQAQTRSEVNRTTKKVYKQKGTGGARHGSRRAPIFVGGGVSHGPRAQRRILTLSGNQKVLSKMAAFNYKNQNKEIVAVEGLGKLEKTKTVAELLKKLTEATGSKRFSFVLADKNTAASRSMRNIQSAKPYLYKEVNAFQIVKGGLIVLDKDIFEATKVKLEKPKTVKSKTIKTNA